MPLVNFPEIRIKKYPRGYVPVIKVKGFWNGYWKHIISYSGISNKPYHFSSYNEAKQELIKYIIKEL